jgi:hypothetical protein
MKGNIKKIIIVVILLLTGVLAVFGLRAAKTYLSGASGGAEPQNVQAQAEAKSATISWQTDKEAQATVEYGTTPASLLLRAPEKQPSTTHRVNLSPLRAGTTYYFRIRVGDKIFDNDGIPFSFKTKGEGTSGQETPTQAAQPTKTQPSPTPAEATGSAQPTAQPTTSEATGSAEKVTECNKAEFTEKFGTSDASYDLDENGTVNTRDWIQCLQNNQ